jgi:energy-coupling factor transporter ATP-binding protein EcfA2
MIEARGLTKRYGDKLAVDDLTFTVRPGMVTGFLGPNGAGKSTTMRMVLGLDAPTRGSVTVNGRPYREHAAPLREVGALLEARSVHPAAAPTTTCWPWPRPPASPGPGWTRSSSRWGWARWCAAGPVASRSAWASVWASRPPCSATPAR